MRRRLPILAVAIALFLGACQRPTPFQQADHDGENGYSVQRVDQDRFHLRFAGNETTSRALVEASLAYLAAQVTLRNGADYFVIESNKTDRTNVYTSFGGYEDPILKCCDWTAVTFHEFEASADITIHKGRMPQDNPAAYDAAGVVEQFGPQIKRGSGYSVY